MTTRKATHKDGEAAIAMLAKERSTTMATTTLRKCSGSARFGIEPHEAPLADFPRQPSRKDGLGAMCDVHWKAYVKGLNADRKARATALVTDTGETVELPAETAKQVDAAITREAKAKAKAARAKADPKVAQAEALIAEVDALPGPEAVRRNGDPDVQAALETVAAANGSARETPRDETLDGGTEEADAA